MRKRELPPLPSPMMCPFCQVLALCSLSLPGRETESRSSIWRWCSTPRRPVSEGQLQEVWSAYALDVPSPNQISLHRPPRRHVAGAAHSFALTQSSRLGMEKNRIKNCLCLWRRLGFKSQIFGESWKQQQRGHFSVLGCLPPPSLASISACFQSLGSCPGEAQQSLQLVNL